mgnify:CR=1 FL=1
MKNYIIRTSNLGYEYYSWEVTTDLPFDKFQEIDLKYGMKYRHESTTIDQLKEGAIKEGYWFGFKRIENTDNVDYIANFGNY